MKSIIIITFWLLAAPTPGEAAPGHKHSATPTLQLQDGKKWETDETLREGMAKLQGLLQSDWKEIAENKLAPDGYAKLAKAISAQVTQVFKDCKHKPGADEMLHIVLLKVVNSADKMKRGNAGSRKAAATQIAKALNEYGNYFLHEGWQSIDI